MPRSPSASSISTPSMRISSRNNDALDNQRAERIWRDHQIADRKKLKHNFPVAVLWIFEHAIEPFFPPGEPFDEYMRKVAVVSFGAMCICSPLTSVFMIIEALTDEYGWTTKRLGTAIAAGYVGSHFFIFNWIFMYRTKKCPMWLTNLSVVGMEITIVLMMVFMPAIDSRSMAVCSMLLISLMGVNLFPLHAAIHAILYLFDYLKEQYREEIPQLVFSWDEDKYPLTDKIVWTFYSTFPQFVSVVGVYVIISGYIKRSKELQLTNVMTITIADQLQRYDTAAVGATITRNKEFVGEKLLDAFDAIRTNLESYRPHIPRYLIDAAVERAEEAEERELEALGRSHATREDLDDDEGSVTASERTRSPSMSLSASGSASQPISALGTPRNACAQVDQVSNPTHTTFSGIVTSVLLRVVDDDKLASTVQTTAINKAVEEINAIAASSSASVHHIQHGVMLVTWNATKRTGNHEIRACNFASRAVMALQAFDGLKDCASAAVLSCKANAYFAGSSQMHFMLSHGETQRHMNMLAIAQRHQTVVVSPSIVRNADIQFYFVGFGVDCKEKLVYELVESKATDNDDEDEWLYAINTQETDAMSPYSRVTTAAAKTLLSDKELALAKNLPGVHLGVEEGVLRINDLPDTLAARSTIKELSTHF